MLSHPIQELPAQSVHVQSHVTRTVSTGKYFFFVNFKNQLTDLTNFFFFTRILQYECDEHICPLGKEDCGNRAFQVLTKELQRGKRYANGFEVVWVSISLN